MSVCCLQSGLFVLFFCLLQTYPPLLLAEEKAAVTRPFAYSMAQLKAYPLVVQAKVEKVSPKLLNSPDGQGQIQLSEYELRLQDILRQVGRKDLKVGDLLRLSQLGGSAPCPGCKSLEVVADTPSGELHSLLIPLDLEGIFAFSSPNPEKSPLPFKEVFPLKDGFLCDAEGYPLELAASALIRSTAKPLMPSLFFKQEETDLPTSGITETSSTEKGLRRAKGLKLKDFIKTFKN